jgi:hypothetical protein
LAFVISTFVVFAVFVFLSCFLLYLLHLGSLVLEPYLQNIKGNVSNEMSPRIFLCFVIIPVADNACVYCNEHMPPSIPNVTEQSN